MSSQHKVTGSQRQQMIAEAAYFRAERRGFNSGDTVRDWCEAEAEVDAWLRQLEDGQLVERADRNAHEQTEMVGAKLKQQRLATKRKR